MKIGILHCGSVTESLLDRFGDYPDMIVAMFEEGSEQHSFSIYNVVNGQFPADINECDAYITTGSRSSVCSDLQWIRDLEAFIIALHKRKKKLIGICFGHQVIATALGGKVKKSAKGWGIGVASCNIVQAKPWVQTQTQFNLIVSHEDQVIELPEGAELLASNAHCELFMYQYRDYILALQGHPEFNKSYTQAMIKQREQLFPAATFAAGLASLALAVDSYTVVEWFNRFLQNGG